MLRAMLLKSCVVMIVLSAAVFSGTCSLRAQTVGRSSAKAIERLLNEQVAAWNRGDIPAFMTGYWKSDQTEFVNSGGVFRGWQNVLSRYLRTYPDSTAMGQLTFSGLEVHVLCPDAAYVLGHWHLHRRSDELEGDFSLIFRKFPRGWRIVLDHTSQKPATATVTKPS